MAGLGGWRDRKFFLILSSVNIYAYLGLRLLRNASPARPAACMAVFDRGRAISERVYRGGGPGRKSA